jgi:hypothetical protein
LTSTFPLWASIPLSLERERARVRVTEEKGEGRREKGEGRKEKGERRKDARHYRRRSASVGG